MYGNMYCTEIYILYHPRRPLNSPNFKAASKPSKRAENRERTAMQGRQTGKERKKGLIFLLSFISSPLQIVSQWRGKKRPLRARSQLLSTVFVSPDIHVCIGKVQDMELRSMDLLRGTSPWNGSIKIWTGSMDPLLWTGFMDLLFLLALKIVVIKDYECVLRL